MEADFQSYLKLAETVIKIKGLESNELKIEAYINTSIFSTHEINLLLSLPSNCYFLKWILKSSTKKILKALSSVMTMKHQFIFFKIVNHLN